MSAGRPPGHVRLMDDLGRFEVAAWLAFTELGMAPYEAANTVTFLASEKPITTESIEGRRLISSTRSHTTPKGHSDRVRRKAEEVMRRADDDERAWLTQSAALIAALVKAIPQLPESRPLVELILELLRNNGWEDVILRVVGRIDASLQSNFPPHQDKLSRKAERMLRQLRSQTRKIAQ